jgi:hypothetical protein
MVNHYGGNLRASELDSLERVIAVLYTDIFGEDLTVPAFSAFRQLVKVFLRRLAITTNDIPMTKGSRLYRIIAGVLNSGVEPEDLTIITFNHDLQIEKALDRLSGMRGRAGLEVFHFPNCYRMEFEQVTSPTTGTMSCSRRPLTFAVWRY